MIVNVFLSVSYIHYQHLVGSHHTSLHCIHHSMSKKRCVQNYIFKVLSICLNQGKDVSLIYINEISYL